MLYKNDDDIFSLKILEYIQFQYLGSEIELGDAIETYELLSDDFFSFFNFSLKINLHSLTEYWCKLELHLKQVVKSYSQRILERTICSCQIGDLSEENLGYYLANCRFNSTYYCSTIVDDQLSNDEVISFFLSRTFNEIECTILANNYLVLSEIWNVEEIKLVNSIQLSVITGSEECNFNRFVYDVSGIFSANDLLSSPNLSESTLNNSSFSFISIFVSSFLVGYYLLYNKNSKRKK